MTITGAGKGLTILDGGSTAESPRSTAVFTVEAPNVKISGLTIQNAADTSSDAPVHISNSAGALPGFEIRDCEFINCHGKNSGGLDTSPNATVGENGIETRANYPIITGCDFTGCGSHGDDTVTQGGAVCGSFWVENSTLTPRESSSMTMPTATLGMLRTPSSSQTAWCSLG